MTEDHDLRQPLPRDFRTYLLFSIFLHLGLLFVLFFTPAFQSEPKKSYTVTWIQLSKGQWGKNLKANVKKKEKQLPQATVREQKYAQKDQARDKTGHDLRSKKSQTLKQIKQKDSLKRTSEAGGINLNKRATKKSTTSSSSRIDKALARIDQQLKQREVRLAMANKPNEDAGQSPVGGSSGVSVKQELIRYASQVKRQISRNWSVARKDFEGNLVTRIAVRIDANGNIMRSSYAKSSGNGSFDASAMRAVRNAAPFPKPPTLIRNEALTEGFLIEFNPTRVR